MASCYVRPESSRAARFAPIRPSDVRICSAAPDLYRFDERDGICGPGCGVNNIANATVLYPGPESLLLFRREQTGRYSSRSSDNRGDGPYRQAEQLRFCRRCGRNCFLLFCLWSSRPTTNNSENRKVCSSYRTCAVSLDNAWIYFVRSPVLSVDVVPFICRLGSPTGQSS